jgi:hypothetical protein
VILFILAKPSVNGYDGCLLFTFDAPFQQLFSPKYWTNLFARFFNTLRSFSSHPSRLEPPEFCEF